MARGSSTGAARSLARRFGGFGGSVLVMGAVNLAVVPIVIGVAGAGQWSGIAVAQSVASFAAVLVAFGWGVTGPAAVAAADGPNRGSGYRSSLAARSWIAAIVVPVMVVTVLLFAPGDPLADVCAAGALLLPALGASWFFIGERSPGRLFVWETVPRATGTILGAAGLLLGAPISAFAVAQLAGAVAAVLLSARSVLGRHPGAAAYGPRAALAAVPGQTAGVLTAVTAALYVNLPMVLVGAVVPTGVATYAIADKVQKLALTAANPVFQVAQGLVAGPDPEAVRLRARRVGLVALIIGVCAAVGFGALAGPMAGLLSAHRLTVPSVVAWSLGVALGAICTTAVVGLACLTALGAVRQVAASTLIGAAVGVPMLALGAVAGGVSGVAVAAAASEVVVAAYQIVHLARLTHGALAGEDAHPLLWSRRAAAARSRLDRPVTGSTPGA